MYICKKHLFLTGLFLSILTVSDAQSAEMQVEHLLVKRLNDSNIDVYYVLPKDKTPKPLLLFCQGSGVDSNTEGVMSLLGLYSDKAVGIALEKQGVNFGDAGGIPTEAYTSHNAVHNRIYDYLRVFQYLRKHTEWWNGEVYVIGGSEGGLLAGMLASMYPNVKGAAILCYGGGLKFGEAWPKAIAFQESKKGKSQKEVDEAVRIAIDSLALATTNPSTKQCYSGADNTLAWWASIIDLRLVNTLIDVDIPLYMAHGSDDQMVPLISAHTVRDAFANAQKTNLKYVEYPGYDHSFTDEEGENHLVEVFIEALNWLLR